MPFTYEERELLASLKRSIDRIDSVLGTVEQRVEIRVRQVVDTVMERLQRIEERVEQHHEYLFVGNGKLSVSTQLKLHEENSERLEEIRRLVASRRWDFAKLIATALFGGTIALLVEHLKR